MTIEAKRIGKSNQERYELAQQWGWDPNVAAYYLHPQLMQLVNLLPFQAFVAPR